MVNEDEQHIMLIQEMPYGGEHTQYSDYLYVS